MEVSISITVDISGKCFCLYKLVKRRTLLFIEFRSAAAQVQLIRFQYNFVCRIKLIEHNISQDFTRCAGTESGWMRAERSCCTSELFEEGEPIVRDTEEVFFCTLKSKGKENSYAIIPDTVDRKLPEIADWMLTDKNVVMVILGPIHKALTYVFSKSVLINRGLIFMKHLWTAVAFNSFFIKRVFETL